MTSQLPVGTCREVICEPTFVDGRSPACADTLGQKGGADAGSEALLGVRPLAQHDVDEGRDTRTDLAGFPLDALRRAVGEAPMARGHVLGQYLRSARTWGPW